VIVIDHHRKAVDYIQNSVIFYHESSASSTCEMVCELLEYIGGDLVTRAEAEALLSGITLDTKNYSINTGVRTFEASAFLRRKGADPLAVKKMFTDSMDNYKIKNSIIATAEQFKNTAIAINNEDISLSQKKLLSSQAADELLNISGVSASFVISDFGEHINISARSLGEINVQVIMEHLGGGGHRTMAACQLSETNTQDAKIKLKNAIDSILEG
jgi:c-di-AMP phosphodiesterase-like protein